MADALHLVKVPFRTDGLVGLAKRRRLPLHTLDEGYLAHAVLREVWQQDAPAPFVLQSAGRVVEAWGYSKAGQRQLQEHAATFGDPTLIAAVDGGVEAIAAKQMPELAAGKRVGFLLRTCPVVRLSSGRGGKKGREVDAFLARCWAAGSDVSVSREAVYREWLAARLVPERSGARLGRVAVDAFQRERFVRRTQANGGTNRRGKTIERPDVRLSGELIVEDSALFRETLRRGIGRHKAFGFGMLLLVPPGRSWKAPGDRGRSRGATAWS